MDLTGAAWRKSTRSNGSGDCAEVADLAGTIGVRDSKDVTGGALAFEPARWSAFVAAIKDGDLTAGGPTSGYDDGNDTRRSHRRSSRLCGYRVRSATAEADRLAGRADQAGRV